MADPSDAVGFLRIDHVQLAMPAGDAAIVEAVAFFGALLGLERVPKPAALAVRGGCWFRGGEVVLHLGVEEPFQPARKAHPALVVRGIDALAGRLAEAGYAVRWSDEIPGVRRFHTDDPWGNRIEIIEG